MEYPYLPQGKQLLSVPTSNEFMLEAKSLADNSGCVKQPTGAVVVKSGHIIGRGSNSGKKVDVCPRWNSSTGQDYDKCRLICEQSGHAEVTALLNALEQGLSMDEISGADVYLYGHWYCCSNCWDKMIQFNIKNVYLTNDSATIFNPEINLEMKNWGAPKK